jgi:hypothetical protein
MTAPDTGYQHPSYAAAFSEFATPIALEESGGWLLRRTIPGSGRFDATGCYPLFSCRNWQGLSADLDRLRNELVSVVIVADPFGNHDPALLHSCFDMVRAYKHHYVIDCERLPEGMTSSRTHRTIAKRALRVLDVEVCSEPACFIDDWERLFEVLVRRHSICGMQRFSRASFEQQLRVPGMTMFRASCEGRTVGLDLWYVQGDCAQGHLAAFDETGYALHASYATKWRLIEHFRDRVRWINLGGGRSASGDDGLSRFKRGWATGARQAWLCGRVLQPETYSDLVSTRSMSGYFPAYRDGDSGPCHHSATPSTAARGVKQGLDEL